MEIARARYKHGQSPRRRPPKNRIKAILLALLLVVSGGYIGLASSKQAGALSGQKQLLQAHAAEDISIKWPQAGQAAFGDLHEGLLASAGHERQQPIASITKVITVLVVLDEKPLELGEQGETYTIGQADIKLYHDYVAKLGSVMPINFGQQLTQYQMIQALMLPSANNIADTLAIWTYGSMDAYLQAANQYLQAHGYEHTKVADASGFSPGSMSTPSDLVRLGQAALSNPVLAEIINQRQAEIPGTGLIRNTNFLMRDKSAVGIKTGTTDEAGYCLLFALKHGPDDNVMIGAVLGQPTWNQLYTEVDNLRDQIVANYKPIVLAPAGTAVGSYQTPWGQSAEAVTLDPISVYGWAGSSYSLEVYLDDVEAPLASGSAVGNAWASVDKSAETKVILKPGIDKPSLGWKVLNYWH